MNKLIEVFKGMKRNLAMTIASLILIFLTITVLGGMVLLSSSTTKTSNNIVSSLQMHLYVDVESTQDQIDDIKKQIEVNPNSGEITYSDKKEQLDQISEDMTENSELINTYFSGKNNPLNSVFYIKPANEAVDMKTFQKELETIENVSSVDYGQDQGADQLISSMVVIKYVSIGIVAILSLVTIFLVINTIKLTIDSRKKEIEIMRLVGATKGYITFPFFLEGLILGLVGGGLAFLLVNTTYNTIYSANGNFLKMLLIAPKDVMIILLLTQVAFGIFIGGAASLIAIRNYLKA